MFWMCIYVLSFVHVNLMRLRFVNVSFMRAELSFGNVNFIRAEHSNSEIYENNALQM